MLAGLEIVFKAVRIVKVTFGTHIDEDDLGTSTDFYYHQIQYLVIRGGGTSKRDQGRTKTRALTP